MVESENVLGFPSEFLEVAACPQCHSRFAVDYEKSELICTNASCALAYPVVDGIPMLLIERARSTKG